MTDEPKKAFKVLTDEEAKAAGLPTEPTAEDIAEGERARAAAAQSPLVAEPPKGYDALPQRTRDEMEAGWRAMGSAGLSPREAYERSLIDTSPPAPVPENIPEPVIEPTAAAKIEMEAGRSALKRHADEATHNAAIVAKLKADELAKGAPANAATDLNYTGP